MQTSSFSMVIFSQRWIQVIHSNGWICGTCVFHCFSMLNPASSSWRPEGNWILLVNCPGTAAGLWAIEMTKPDQTQWQLQLGSDCSATEMVNLVQVSKYNLDWETTTFDFDASTQMHLLQFTYYRHKYLVCWALWKSSKKYMPWFQPDWISNLNFHANPPLFQSESRPSRPRGLPLGSPGWWQVPTGPCLSGLQRPLQVSPASGWRDSDCHWHPKAPSCSCCNLWLSSVEKALQGNKHDEM